MFPSVLSFPPFSAFSTPELTLSLSLRFERTQNYSPVRSFADPLLATLFTHHLAFQQFLMNVILAVGCRYLDPEEDYPPEICGLLGDSETRGDVFVTWSRYLLDQEWCVGRGLGEVGERHADSPILQVQSHTVDDSRIGA
jgi:hypothetical protein